MLLSFTPPRSLLRVLVAVVATGVLAGCAGGAAEPRRSATRPDPAVEQIAELDERVAALEDALDEERLKDARAQRRLKRSSQRLWKAVGRLRDALDAARAGAAAADADAQEAAARIDDVAAELSVLADRYDYHLRRYHGGG